MLNFLVPRGMLKKSRKINKYIGEKPEDFLIIIVNIKLSNRLFVKNFSTQWKSWRRKPIIIARIVNKKTF